MSRRHAQRRTRKRCRTFERFVTEGTEKADELAKESAMLDEGFIAENVFRAESPIWPDSLWPLGHLRQHLACGRR